MRGIIKRFAPAIFLLFSMALSSCQPPNPYAGARDPRRLLTPSGDSGSAVQVNTERIIALLEETDGDRVRNEGNSDSTRRSDAHWTDRCQWGDEGDLDPYRNGFSISGIGRGTMCANSNNDEELAIQFERAQNRRICFLPVKYISRRNARYLSYEWFCPRFSNGEHSIYELDARDFSFKRGYDAGDMNALLISLTTRSSSGAKIIHFRED